MLRKGKDTSEHRYGSLETKSKKQGPWINGNLPSKPQIGGASRKNKLDSSQLQFNDDSDMVNPIFYDINILSEHINLLDNSEQVSAFDDVEKEIGGGGLYEDRQDMATHNNINPSEPKFKEIPKMKKRHNGETSVKGSGNNNMQDSQSQLEKVKRGLMACKG